MQTCSNCQASQLDSSRFCSVCGSQIEKVVAPAQEFPVFEVPKTVPTQDYKPAEKTMNLKPETVIVCAVAILILVLGFILYKSQLSSNSADSQVADSFTTNSDNSNSIPPASDYTSSIPTEEIVSTISSKLGVNINQDDPTRSITFPDISSEADVWSAPYITLIIYPDADALNSDKDNFQQDMDSLNGGRSWESCTNLVVINPPSKQSKIQSVLSNWCTFDTP